MANLNVVFVGTTQSYGYQFSAANTKTEFMARGLVESGARVTIHNGIIGCSDVRIRTIKTKELIGNIITYPKKNNQLISWVRNLTDFKRDLKHLYDIDAKNVIILEAPDYHIYRLYCYYARKYGYKIAVISHEWLPTIKGVHPLRRPFNKKYSERFGYYADGILPISEYIIEKIKHFGKPYIKVPVLAEYASLPQKNGQAEYFLYCVYAAYTRVIIPLIDAFHLFKLQCNCDHKLILVLGGGEKYVSVIREYLILNKLYDEVEIRQNLPYGELLSLYDNASGLLIPLDPASEQDKARFSQKIAEYSSSATPIISCNVGEMGYYFKDKESAVFCEYSKVGFANAFSWIVTNANKARNIGYSGYNVGRKCFDYKLVCDELYNFLIAL